MDYRIRRVKQGDAPALAQIQTSSWKTAFRGILSDDDLERLTNIAKATAMYQHLLNEGIGNGYIGEVDGKAHCIAYWDRTRDADMPDYAEIICIHSLPDNWRKGFGSKMMDRLLADIAQAGFKKVMLWVFVENARARAFYEAKGFRPTNKIKPSFGTMEICYERNL